MNYEDNHESISFSSRAVRFRWTREGMELHYSGTGEGASADRNEGERNGGRLGSSGSGQRANLHLRDASANDATGYSHEPESDAKSESNFDERVLSDIKFFLDLKRGKQQVELDFARRQRNWRVRLGVGEQPEHAKKLRQLLEYEHEFRSRWCRWCGVRE